MRVSDSITLSNLRADLVYQADNIYAVFVHDPRLGYSMALREEVIGGVALEFNDGQPLYIYSEGKIYELKAAYENRIIDVGYLRKLQTALVGFKRTYS